MNSANPHIMKTKKATVAHFKEQLSSNRGWAVRGLLRIYEYQTAHEQNCFSTVEHNNVGFSGCDAEILSSFAQQFKARNWLSDRQLGILHKKMPKYAKQLYNISVGLQ